MSRCHSHSTSIDAIHQNATKTKPPIQPRRAQRTPSPRPRPREARDPGRTAGAAGRRSARRVTAGHGHALCPHEADLTAAGSTSGAEPPLARRILLQRGDERRIVEIGPQDRQEHEFGVGRLPEQEIRQPHFAGRADDEVRIGNVRRYRAARRIRSASIACGIETPVANVARQAPRRLDDLLPRRRS